MFARCLSLPPVASRCLPLPPVVSRCLPSRFSILLLIAYHLLVVSRCLPSPPVLMRLARAVSLPFARCLPLSLGAFRCLPLLPLYPVVSRCLHCLPLPPVAPRCPQFSPVACATRRPTPASRHPKPCNSIPPAAHNLTEPPNHRLTHVPTHRPTSPQLLAAHCLRPIACPRPTTPCDVLTANDLLPTASDLQAPTSVNHCHNNETNSSNPDTRTTPTCPTTGPELQLLPPHHLRSRQALPKTIHQWTNQSPTSAHGKTN